MLPDGNWRFTYLSGAVSYLTIRNGKAFYRSLWERPYIEQLTLEQAADVLAGAMVRSLDGRLTIERAA